MISPPFYDWAMVERAIPWPYPRPALKDRSTFSRHAVAHGGAMDAVGDVDARELGFTDPALGKGSAPLFPRGLGRERDGFEFARALPERASTASAHARLRYFFVSRKESKKRSASQRLGSPLPFSPVS